jgi:hypothetical protein
MKQKDALTRISTLNCFDNANIEQFVSNDQMFSKTFCF